MRETAPYALRFARAALAAGDGALARSWLAASDFEGIAPPDPFDIAVLEALDLISGGEKSGASQRAIQARLLEAAKSSAQKKYTANILTMWTGFGLSLTTDARAFLVAHKSSAPRIDPFTLVAIQSAARSGAIGETALMVLNQTKGAPDKLSSADLAVLIAALRRVGADDVAAGLALEASGFWKRVGSGLRPARRAGARGGRALSLTRAKPCGGHAGKRVARFGCASAMDRAQGCTLHCGLVCVWGSSESRCARGVRWGGGELWLVVWECVCRGGGWARAGGAIRKAHCTLHVGSSATIRVGASTARAGRRNGLGYKSRMVSEVEPCTHRARWFDFAHHAGNFGRAVGTPAGTLYL